MSVYAKAHGTIIFKTALTKEARAKINDVLLEGYQEIWDRVDDPAEVRFYDEYFKPFSTTIALKTLNKIPEMREIKKGDVEYIGEENVLWRFIYREGKWHLEDGHVEYHKITTDRVMNAFRAYVYNDAATADPDYIREVLRDTCGLTEQELQEIGIEI